jgi:hypothetical protein
MADEILKKKVTTCLVCHGHIPMISPFKNVVQIRDNWSKNGCRGAEKVTILNRFPGPFFDPPGGPKMRTA